MQVKGEIEAVGWLEGSSGRFTGDIEGLYEGHRDGNPPVQSGLLQLANGTLALELHHQWQIPMPPRPAEHPFAGTKTLAEFAKERRPPGMAGGPGGPGGPGAPGGPGGPGRPGAQEGPPDHRDAAFRDKWRTKVLLRAVPEKSTGIFAGATGEMAVSAPAHKEAGYMVIQAKDGNLRLTFLEWPEGTQLVADLSVDGAGSTGVYRNARGTLRFALDRIAVGVAKGTYSGVLEVQGAGR